MFVVLAQVELAHPGRLAALLILPLLVLIAYRYAPFAAAWQRPASLACRLTLAALLVVALAGPLYRYTSNQRLVVFAVDNSASISSASREAAKKYLAASQTAAGSNKTAVIQFAGAAGPVANAL